MVQVALYQPEIPPNTGNIIRLCANTGARLHLIHPLGFSLDDKRARRAGLDYRELANLTHHENYPAFIKSIPDCRIFALSTKGTRVYSEPEYQADDILLFGPETRGLPDEILNHMNARQILRLPMQPQSRSLNLSNTVAVCVYECWRQGQFSGGQ